ncbi:MAG: Rieske (2Fe-2S) protein [Gemmatimonadota bacterium]
MSDWVRVTAAEEVPPGQLKAARAGETLVVLANVDGTICAVEDRCSHEDFPLSDGELDGDEIVCTYHGARFDACSGRNKCLPAVRPVRAFPVDIRDGDVWVQVG